MNESNDPLESIGRALRAIGSDMEPVELHGHLVGLLCAQGTVDRQEWLRRIAPERPAGDILAREAVARLEALMEETVRQMNDPVLGFHPLLPAEGAALEEKVHALGEWCQGMLLGLSEGGMDKLDALPEDGAEIVQDLVEISRAGNYLMEEGEEDENAYTELLEYVRTGVLLLNEELNPTKAPPLPPTTYH